MKQENITEETIKAFLHLVNRGLAAIEFEKEAQKLFDYSQDYKEDYHAGSYKPLTGEALERWAMDFLMVVDAGARAGKLRDPELFLHRIYPIERVHEERFTDGTYSNKLKAINQKCDAIRKKFGLEDDEVWLIGEGPEEWKLANAEYDLISDDLFVEALIEFGADDLAYLFKNDPGEFERRRENGRLSIFTPPQDLNKVLNELRNQFFKESEICAQIGAYHAACVMLGATLETTVLALCYKNKAVAVSTANKLPSKNRPRRKNEPTEWTFAQLVQVADEAGWLPNLSMGDYELRTRGLIDLVRQLRNTVHPGRHIQTGEKIKVGEPDYLDVKAIYQIVRSQVILPLLETI